MSDRSYLALALQPRRRHDPGGNWMELGFRLCVEAHIGGRSYGNRSPGRVWVGCSGLASVSFEAHLEKYKQNFKKGHLLVAMTVPPLRTTVELLDASCSLKPPRNGADHMRDFQRDGKRDARIALSAASLQQFRLPCSTHDLMAVDHAWDLSQVLARSFTMRPVRKSPVWDKISSESLPRRTCLPTKGAARLLKLKSGSGWVHLMLSCIPEVCQHGFLSRPGRASGARAMGGCILQKSVVTSTCYTFCSSYWAYRIPNCDRFPGRSGLKHLGCSATCQGASGPVLPHSLS